MEKLPLKAKQSTIPRLKKEKAQIQAEIARLEQDETEAIGNLKKTFAVVAIWLAIMFFACNIVTDKVAQSLLFIVFFGILGTVVFLILGFYRYSKVLKNRAQLTDLYEKLYEIEFELKEAKKQRVGKMFNTVLNNLLFSDETPNGEVD